MTSRAPSRAQGSDPTLLHAVQAVVARLARTLLDTSNPDTSNPDASNPDASERDFDRAVDRALAEVGELIRAARAYVFVIEGSRTSNTHEWCGPGVTPQRDNLQHLAVEDFEVFFSPLRSRKPLYVPCVAELPDQDATKGVLEAQGIQRLLAVPMHRGGALSGFVGIDDPKADLRGPTDLVEPMVLLADVLSAAFAHRARRTALEEERAWRALVLKGSSAILYSASFPDFRVDFVSDSIRAVLGVEPEEARAPGFWLCIRTIESACSQVSRTSSRPEPTSTSTGAGTRTVRTAGCATRCGCSRTSEEGREPSELRST